MPTFLLATRNRHKVAEIQAVLGDAHRFLTLADFPDAPAVIEDADTFAGNAAKKACALAAWMAGRDLDAAWVLADDSGLEVDALGGAPGVHSARFAALDTGQSGNSSDAENNAKLLRLLSGRLAAPRAARFRCVIALARVPRTGEAAGAQQLFDGTCEGGILMQARGGGGFGYDPLFQPEGFEGSFAELGEATKNRISHRARALAKLRDWLATQPAGV